MQYIFKQREQINNAAQGNNSSYAAGVSMVNNALDKNNVPVPSPDFNNVVLNNLRYTGSGEMNSSTAHMNETRSLASNAQQTFKKGEYKNSLVSTFGALANFGASMGTSLIEGANADREYKTGRRFGQDNPTKVGPFNNPTSFEKLSQPPKNN